VDGGQLYDAMCAALMDQGVCVFRNCARGTRALVRYIETRLYADTLRSQPGNKPSNSPEQVPSRCSGDIINP
jgi:hypothetical protein